MIKNTMKITLITGTLLFITPAQAQCVGSIVLGKCQQFGNLDPILSDSNYRTSSGAEYQYNLNDPRDQNDYLMDYDAQRRDMMNSDPRQMYDINQGQMGGGIYD